MQYIGNLTFPHTQNLEILAFCHIRTVIGPLCFSVYNDWKKSYILFQTSASSCGKLDSFMLTMFHIEMQLSFAFRDRLIVCCTYISEFKATFSRHKGYRQSIHFVHVFVCRSTKGLFLHFYSFECTHMILISAHEYSPLL